MYYLIEFKDQLLYSIIDKAKTKDSLIEQLSDSRIVTTDDFLEQHFTLTGKKDLPLYYYKWILADAFNGKKAYIDLKSYYHFILIYNKWNVCAKLRDVTEKYFYFRTDGSLEIYLTNFIQGDPFDNNLSGTI